MTSDLKDLQQERETISEMAASCCAQAELTFGYFLQNGMQHRAHFIFDLYPQEVVQLVGQNFIILPTLVHE